MDYERYKNEDDTYTSPINGKIYKNLRSIRSHIFCQENGPKPTDKPRIIKKYNCSFCGVKRTKSNVGPHEDICNLNPKNIRPCLVCGNPVKDKTRQTCSYACSNKHFRTGENHGNWKEDYYRSTCFLHHKKECVICGEDKIVEVHHLDGEHANNEPSNLIPLCPTHHQYWHSRYKVEVEQKVVDYITQWCIMQ